MTSESIVFEDTALTNILEARNINMKRGDKVILENVSFLVEDAPNVGQFISVCGRSGCGKSQTMRIICGLEKPTSGDVLINGQPAATQPKPGMVFQQYSSLPHLTALENVRLALDFQGKSRTEGNKIASDMLDYVGLGPQKNKYARYPNMSGGELQRVAIARSLVASPQILLLDEPFGALDVHTRYALELLVHKICHQLQNTMILVTHFPDEAIFLSNEVWVMKANPGKIVDRIIVPFSVEQRNSELKRDPLFRKMKDDLEDIIMARAA